MRAGLKIVQPRGYKSTVEQLSQAKTLYGVKNLDPALEQGLREAGYGHNALIKTCINRKGDAARGQRPLSWDLC